MSYTPYTGGSGPDPIQKINNTIALACLAKAKLEWLPLDGLSNYTDAEGKDIDLFATKNGRSANYDRWGFCSGYTEKDLESEVDLDQNSMELAIKYLCQD